MNLDGFQAAVLHPQAELFVDFLDPVLLKAIAHTGDSVRDRHIAMLNAACFERRRTFKQRIKASMGQRNLTGVSEQESHEGRPPKIQMWSYHPHPPQADLVGCGSMSYE